MSNYEAPRLHVVGSLEELTLKKKKHKHHSPDGVFLATTTPKGATSSIPLGS